MDATARKELLQAFTDHLLHHRNYSPNTVEAYLRDVTPWLEASKEIGRASCRERV